MASVDLSEAGAAAFEKKRSKAKSINGANTEDVQSKKEKQDIITHNFESDVIKGEPIIELMRVCRDFRKTDAELIAKQQDYKSQKEEINQDWQNLRENEILLRGSFIRYDEFIKENYEKRERAERMIKDQKELQKIRNTEIVELENTLESLETIRYKMQNYVEKYKSFQQYMETVLKTSEFTSIAEIFNRYETLIDIRETIEKNQSRKLHALGSSHIQLQQLMQEKSQSMMNLNSQLAILQIRHRRARANALHWEMLLTRIKQLIKRKELEEAQIRACIWNLYRQVCKRKGIPADATQNDLEQQMLIIKRTIIELRKILYETKRRVDRDKKVVVKWRCMAENS
ncbi:PREDICTED: coiled-coil domain-containing protein 42A [Ceratosolen solmsi marchali]|uniref:Coiled-coil domain-containing protein 42A n=1 Tax=Ceratosolen solmsi marchali TaxID=326594 RepID=A0AAJ7DU93_9HYME|nr:PREDICTED: coiled-coil domain-containing protein 42A [Ceratosolen solmsi marchali]